MCFVYLKADLKGYCSSLIKSRMTLVMKRTDVFREMTLVICSGSCLQECELKHLSVPDGAKTVGFIYILYETLCRAAVPVRFMFTR